MSSTWPPFTGKTEVCFKLYRVTAEAKEVKPV